MDNVTPSVIATVLGRPSPTPTQIEQWSYWLTDARMLLRLGDGSHAGLGDLDLLDQDALSYVIREAVIAQIRRPDDATQVDIAVDDGRVSRTYASATGRVTIRDEWWEMLNPTGSEGGAFTISPTIAPGYAPGACWPPASGYYPNTFAGY